MLLLATALAALIGLLLGMLGGGGSVLMIPVLLYVLMLEPKSALATSQLILSMTSVVAMIAHAVQGRVVYATGLLFGVTGMLGAYLGGRTAHYVPPRLLLAGFVALLIVSATQMLRKSAAQPAPARPQAQRLVRGLGLGLCTGFVAGLLGAGGGFLVVPALVLFGGLPMPQAIGTSLLVIALQSFAGSLGYLGHATVEWKLAGELGVTMAAASIGGSLVGQYVPAPLLRRMFGGLLIAVALFMLARILW